MKRTGGRSMILNQQVPSLPIIVHHPYLSLWLPAKELYGACIEHWCGLKRSINGHILIDGKVYRFMGVEGGKDVIEQVGIDLTPTSTSFYFENEQISLEVKFTSPLLLDDLELLSRPCTYVCFKVTSKDDQVHDIQIVIDMNQSHVQNGESLKPVIGETLTYETYQLGFLGQVQQNLLAHSGDGVGIDWGYLYMVLPNQEDVKGKIDSTQHLNEVRSKILNCEAKEDQGAGIVLHIDLGKVREEKEVYSLITYDEMLAIMYFNRALPPYWARDGKTIIDVIAKALDEKEEVLSRCKTFDKQLEDETDKLLGESYRVICTLAYRQTIAAHQLIEDEKGEVIFLSKECCSNGCIGTVDVSYPSSPLFLLYNTELLKGMLRPIFRFEALPIWPFKYAPHDVGRYPYATGQVYGLSEEGKYIQGKERIIEGGIGIYPNYTHYPKEKMIYDEHYQMPIEECGNMLILCAAICKCEGHTEFVKPYIEVLEKWANYLVSYGIDPGEQLCTDDFAGHLAHNVNLSLKAIIGVASFGVLLDEAGEKKKANQYKVVAKQMSKEWTDRARGKKHTPLSFTEPESWSLKYNLVWDELLELNLFDEKVKEQEVEWYMSKMGPYGVPLDSRVTYTKSDWSVWCAALTTDRSKAQKMVDAVARFLDETPDKVPFTDWYETVTGVHHLFRNRTVQGGLFLPLLRKYISKKTYE
ncbi:DUF4965 domain-containing protein [Niameybacter massiliensis]|uniref:DUF4965 domain-containing protein n=1 Tax=Holtiella tumoricola TaxID=3018743 RepID=A0AA42DNP0_9FIRM|nr:DUF4965 domain-containing protein [Holtiella tumoricola]MDA3732338.1 DUF4965 domain-containing protein [Holtiella tumoricola]